MADPGAVLDDLRDESEELDGLIEALSPESWTTPTPAPGWTIAHQIAHLAWTDQQALRATVEPVAFRRGLERLSTLTGVVDEAAVRGAEQPPGVLLAEWRAGRKALRQALLTQPPGARLPWFGPSMGVAAMATGRLMETWAHGLDIADALGTPRRPTARLRHVVRIGVRARDYCYAAHGLTPPAEEFRVELTPPLGAAAGPHWTYGPEDAVQRVTGSAWDFCLLVTQRAHRADTSLRAEGTEADRWLGIAQAFAGPPGAGRKPGERAR